MDNTNTTSHTDTTAQSANTTPAAPQAVEEPAPAKTQPLETQVAPQASAPQPAEASALQPADPRRYAFFDRYIQPVIHGIVLVLSLALIVWISYDTFKQIPFLDNHEYMMFQFWVCVIFLGAFFSELIASDDKKKYLKSRWFFFVISIPYLNIIEQWHIMFSPTVLYYLRFVPLVRGAYSLALVMGFISKNRAISLLVQYAAILTALVYLLAMVFYYQEFGINTNVKTFWDALYWSAMNMTTVGCYFSAVTPAGKVISVILPILGMLMLPLFTVYVTDLVRRHNMTDTAA